MNKRERAGRLLLAVNAFVGLVSLLVKVAIMPELPFWQIYAANAAMLGGGVGVVLLMLWATE